MVQELVIVLKGTRAEWTRALFGCLPLGIFQTFGEGVRLIFVHLHVWEDVQV